MSTPNWSKLVEQGRAKALGISWSEEELKALYEYKIPAEYVREGVLTLADYQNTTSLEADKPKLPRYMKRDELIGFAKSKGLQFDATSVTRADLILLLERKSSAGTPLEVAKLKQEEPAGA